MTISAKVEGVAALEARFNAIPEKIRLAARQALEKVAQDIVDMARRLCPVRSGALQASIGWTWGDAPAGSLTLGSVGAAKGQPQTYGAMRITIYAGGDAVFYARWQEFGTSEMAANPFFFPAYRASRRRARAAVTRAIGKAIRA